jgi:hypothetical protein
MKNNSVFISHSSIDKPFVDKLVNDLTKIGVTVWYDKLDIQLGDSIPGKINDGLTKAKYFIIVLSNASIKSRWVKEELNSALMKQINLNGTFIIPVVISECQIPPLLMHRRYLDLRNNYDFAIQELFDLLKKDLEVTDTIKDKQLFPWPDSKIQETNYLYLHSTRFDKFFKMYCDFNWTANDTIDYIVNTLNLPWNTELSELGMRWSFSYGLVFNDDSIGLDTTLMDIGLTNGSILKINISGTYEDIFEDEHKSMWDGTKMYEMGSAMRREQELKNKIRNRGDFTRERLKEIADSCFSHV